MSRDRSNPDVYVTFHGETLSGVFRKISQACRYPGPRGLECSVKRIVKYRAVTARSERKDAQVKKPVNQTYPRWFATLTRSSVRRIDKAGAQPVFIEGNKIAISNMNNRMIMENRAACPEITRGEAINRVGAIAIKEYKP